MQQNMKLIKCRGKQYNRNYVYNINRNKYIKKQRINRLNLKIITMLKYAQYY